MSETGRRFTPLEERIEAWARRRTDALSRSAGPLRRGLVELVVFGLKQAWACVFGAAMLALLVIARVAYPDDALLARSDALVLAAVALQVLMVAFRLESGRVDLPASGRGLGARAAVEARLVAAAHDDLGGARDARVPAAAARALIHRCGRAGCCVEISDSERGCRCRAGHGVIVSRSVLPKLPARQRELNVARPARGRGLRR